jgi:hypothetical protein
MKCLQRPTIDKDREERDRIDKLGSLVRAQYRPFRKARKRGAPSFLGRDSELVEVRSATPGPPQPPRPREMRFAWDLFVGRRPSSSGHLSPAAPETVAQVAFLPDP